MEVGDGDPCNSRDVSVIDVLETTNVVTLTISTTKGGLRKISILYWMWEKTGQRLRKQLRYLMLPLLLSLVVNPVVLWVPRPLSGKTGMESE